MILLIFMQVSRLWCTTRPVFIYMAAEPRRGSQVNKRGLESSVGERVSACVGGRARDEHALKAKRLYMYI